MKKSKSLWKDLISETPKIYKWICGALVSISASAGVIAISYSELPTQLQVLPDSALKGIAITALVGAAIAKKQNVK